MIKYGIKLWSINKQWFKEAIALFKSGQIDFLELYIVPDSFTLKEFRPLREMPVFVHTPHSSHNFNVFKLDRGKIELFKTQVVKTADFLNSQSIIVHAGVGRDQAIFRQNIAKIFDPRVLIENMPKVGFVHLRARVCFGYSLADLKFIHQGCGFNICLDLAHAVKSAFSQGLNYKDFISSLITELNPFYFHISGGNQGSEVDEHLNLFEGDFDLAWIKGVLQGLAEDKDIYLVFETPKIGKGLKNDIKNINYFKKNGH